MRLNSRILIWRLFYAGGLVSFICHRSPTTLTMAISILYAAAVAWQAGRTRSFFDAALIPFSSGWLILLMRFFYWDRWDFDLRIDLLLGLSLVFSLLLAGRRLRWRNRLFTSFNTLTPRKKGVVIFLGCELVFILSSLGITRRGVKLVGDEPHYLVIAQSIVRDFDLNVFNQYYRNQFGDFIEVEKLPVHGTFGKGEKRIFSYHLPGLAFTLAPFLLPRLPFEILYILIRSYLGLFAAGLAVLVYFFSLRLFERPNIAFFICSVYILSVPVFFYSFHIFPEIQATLLLLGALYLLLFPGARENRSVLLAGLLLGLMLFWGVKYSLFVYLYVVGFAVYFVRKRLFRRTLLLILFPILCQLLLSYYLVSSYGSISPNAVYFGMMNDKQNRELADTLLRKITTGMRLETLLDYFFDQRDGLLPYAPFYFFALPGLVLAFRRFRSYRSHLLIIAPGILFIFYHALSTVRAGYCPQGRYLVPASWALMILAMIFYLETPNLWLKRLFPYVPLYSLLVIVYQVITPATLYQPTTHDALIRPGLMFQQWSNLQINLPPLLPSYVKIDNSGYLPNIIFLGLAILGAALALAPVRKTGIRWFSVTVFMGSFILLSLFPRPGLYQPTIIDHPGQMAYSLFHRNPQVFRTGIFALEKKGDYHFLIATTKSASAFVLKWENPPAEGRAVIRMYLFDRLLKVVALGPGASGQSTFDRPETRRSKGLFLYPFHLVYSPASGDQKVKTTFELFPQKSAETDQP
jgi:hypothetical protein